MSCCKDIIFADNTASASKTAEKQVTLPRPRVRARFSSADDTCQRERRFDGWFSASSSYNYTDKNQFRRAVTEKCIILFLSRRQIMYIDVNEPSTKVQLREKPPALVE